MTSKAFDPTKPVQTRDGRKAVILETGRPSSIYVIAASYQDSDGDWQNTTYTVDGYLLDGDVCDEDLINIPEVHPFLKGTDTHYMNFGGSFTYREGSQQSYRGWPVLAVTVTDGVVVSTKIIEPLEASA